MHFHAVIRLDGPRGSINPAPAWATLPVLEQAIRAAAARVAVTTPVSSLGQWTLTFGVRVDIRPIRGFEQGVWRMAGVARVICW